MSILNQRHYELHNLRTELLASVKKACDELAAATQELMQLEVRTVSAWRVLNDQLFCPPPEEVALGAVVGTTRLGQRIHVVYGLREEGSDIVRYVGQSISPASRFWTHVALPNGDGAGNSNVNRWAVEVQRAGRHVEMFVIDTAVDQQDLNVKEMLWICRYRNRGQADLNRAINKAVLLATAEEAA